MEIECAQERNGTKNLKSENQGSLKPSKR